MTTASFRLLPLARQGLALALGVISAVLLAGGWWFELGLGLKPCKLCLIGRQPHYAGSLSLLVARP